MLRPSQMEGYFVVNSAPNSGIYPHSIKQPAILLSWIFVGQIALYIIVWFMYHYVDLNVRCFYVNVLYPYIAELCLNQCIN